MFCITLQLNLAIYINKPDFCPNAYSVFSLAKDAKSKSAAAFPNTSPVESANTNAYFKQI